MRISFEIDNAADAALAAKLCAAMAGEIPVAPGVSRQDTRRGNRAAPAVVTEETKSAPVENAGDPVALYNQVAAATGAPVVVADQADPAAGAPPVVADQADPAAGAPPVVTEQPGPAAAPAVQADPIAAASAAPQPPAVTDPAANRKTLTDMCISRGVLWVKANVIEKYGVKGMSALSDEQVAAIIAAAG